MTYKNFEDLPVWQEAIRLAESVYDLTESVKGNAPSGLRDQLERAALSVSNNIAEGFERGTTNQLLQFIYIARGSAGEVRSMLCLMERRKHFAHLKSGISNLKSLAASCSRQLRGWADSLQNSDIKGQRHLTARSRSESDQKQKAAALQKKLLSMLPSGHPLQTSKETTQ